MSWKALKASVTPKSGSMIHRKDIEAERKKAYLDDQNQKKKARDEKRKQWMISEEIEDTLNEEEGKAGYVPKQEVIKRLRERSEPITLFGETELERRKRLKRIVAEEYDRGDLGKGTTKKDLITKAMEDTLATQRHKLESGVSQAEAEAAAMVDIQDQLSQRRLKLESSLESMSALDDIKNPSPADMNPQKSSNYVTFFINTILVEWDISLLSRSAVLKKSFKGRNESARYEETVVYLSPLLKGLAANQIPETQVASFQKMAFHALQGEYVKSHDLYLKMSIGTAAWPLGVTQVGIHSRVGRERISSNKQAHILNNDVHRKFISGFKRLITQRQTLHPSEPSKMVAT